MKPMCTSPLKRYRNHQCVYIGNLKSIHRGIAGQRSLHYYPQGFAELRQKWRGLCFFWTRDWRRARCAQNTGHWYYPSQYDPVSTCT